MTSSIDLCLLLVNIDLLLGPEWFGRGCSFIHWLPASLHIQVLNCHRLSLKLKMYVDHKFESKFLKNGSEGGGELCLEGDINALENCHLVHMLSYLSFKKNVCNRIFLIFLKEDINCRATEQQLLFHYWIFPVPPPPSMPANTQPHHWICQTGISNKLVVINFIPTSSSLFNYKIICLTIADL